VRTALGDLWVEYRWTKKQKLTDVVATAVFGPFGVAAPLDAEARKVMKLTRGTPPASVDTITTDNLVVGTR
jgi:hypothetical protein